MENHNTNTTQAEIDAGEQIEREQLYQWIPELFESEKDNLTIRQLRIIHCVLGYNTTVEADRNIIELFEPYGYNEDEAEEILAILHSEKFNVIRLVY